MANALITDTLIERETLCCALRLGMIKNLNSNKNFKALYCIGDNRIHLYGVHEGKSIDLPFENNELLWSLDDLAEKLIIPSLMTLLDRDLSFIHNDET